MSDRRRNRAWMMMREERRSRLKAFFPLRIKKWNRQRVDLEKVRHPRRPHALGEDEAPRQVTYRTTKLLR